MNRYRFFTAIVAGWMLLSVPTFAKGKGGDVAVRGYWKRNGTYVAPHFRTAPDTIRSNNFSHLGNVNPYTGKVGTKIDQDSKGYGVENGTYGGTETAADCTSRCAQLWARDQLRSGVTFDDCRAALCN